MSYIRKLANTMDLINFLTDRLLQLEDRKFMIPKYVKKPGTFLGKKDFSLDDLPKIEKDIEETKAAIKVVKGLRKIKPKK